MALPKNDLELNFDPDELTLDEMDILSIYSIKLFKEFVVKYGNWTAKDVGKITRKEWLGLQSIFYEKLLAVMVPKENGTT